MTHVRPLISALFSILLTTHLSSCSSSDSPQELPASSFIKGINFVGQSVSNMQNIASFYESAVELQQVLHAGRAEFSADWANVSESSLVRSSNAQVLLMQFNERSNTNPVPVNGPGIAHLCFQVDAKTNAYQRFLAHGAITIGDPEMVQLSERNPVQYAYIQDLDKNIIEVEHVDVDALQLDTPPKHQYRVRHVSLATPDMDGAISFYSKLLAQKKPRRIGRWWKLSGDKLDRVSGLEGSKIEMAWFQVHNLELEIIQYHSHPPTHKSLDRQVSGLGYNMIVFEVDSLESAKREVAVAGGELIEEKAIIFGVETLFARDPDGNLLGFQATDASHVLSSRNIADNGL